MTEIILHHHLGLGDHFICNGLVNVISNQAKIYLISKSHNYESVSCLYSNNFNVIPITISDIDYSSEMIQVDKIQRILDKPLFRVGFKNIELSSFDKLFYDSIDMPFEYRYTQFQLPKVNLESDALYQKLSANKSSYALVHRQSSEGIYPINIESKLPVIEVDFSITRNMMNWVDLIKNAEEIHCVPSSFFCLVDSIATQSNTKLYYHDIRKSTVINPNNNFNSNKWKIISYNEKI